MRLNWKAIFPTLLVLFTTSCFDKAPVYSILPAIEFSNLCFSEGFNSSTNFYPDFGIESLRRDARAESRRLLQGRRSFAQLSKSCHTPAQKVLVSSSPFLGALPRPNRSCKWARRAVARGRGGVPAVRRGGLVGWSESAGGDAPDRGGDRREFWGAGFG